MLLFTLLFQGMVDHHAQFRLPVECNTLQSYIRLRQRLRVLPHTFFIISTFYSSDWWAIFRTYISVNSKFSVFWISRIYFSEMCICKISWIYIISYNIYIVNYLIKYYYPRPLHPLQCMVPKIQLLCSMSSLMFDSSLASWRR